MTNRLELNWKLDGFVDEQRYYCSEVPIDVNNLPAPKAVLPGDALTHTDAAIEIGKTYHVCVSSVKNNTEKFSEIKSILTGKEFSPSDISSIKMLIDENSLITHDSNIVSSVVDQITNSSFVQTIEGRKPLLVSNGLNGKNILRFSSDVLYTSDLNLRQQWNNTPVIWSFAVYKSIASSTRDKCYFSINTVAQNPGYAAEAGAPAAYDVPYVYGRRFGSQQWKGRSDVNVKLDEWVMCYSEINFAGDGLRISTNGGVIRQSSNAWGSTNNTEQANAYSINIGASNRDIDSVFNGDIACIIFGSGDILMQDEIDKIMGWAAHKYGLTTNLPVDHPYKDAPP